jgi:hypothetical protein
MRERSFDRWLMDEVITARGTLLGLYEQRDRLLYAEAPQLRKEYMEKIGAVEESVLQAELDAAMLRRKLELVQAAVNRREPIDPAALEAKLEQEKAQRLAELEQQDATLSQLPTLSAEEAEKMQRQYREITEAFHPAVNADITQTQKELYTKAVEAYKNQDAGAMGLIYELLFPPAEISGIRLSFCVAMQNETGADTREEYRTLAAELSADYRLAKELYGCFRPLEEDVVMQHKLQEYTALRNALEADIAQIRAGFPFNAAAPLKDPEKTADYLAELRVRAKNAAEEKAALNAKIEALAAQAEGSTNGRAENG